MAVDVDELLIVYRPDYETRAVDLLYRQWKGKRRLEAFARALACGAQELEALCWSVIAGGSLDAAEGETLRRWGALVGEAQGGLTHEQYRRFIALRARVNTQFPNEDMQYELLLDALAPHDVVTRYAVSDGVVWEVRVPELPSDVVGEHTGGLMRDARPLGFYTPVVVFTISSFGWLTDWDSDWAELLYDGRSRAR